MKNKMNLKNRKENKMNKECKKCGKKIHYVQVCPYCGTVN